MHSMININVQQFSIELKELLHQVCTQLDRLARNVLMIPAKSFQVACNRLNAVDCSVSVPMCIEPEEGGIGPKHSETLASSLTR